MKVLAIGAGGFIGSHAVRLLAEQGHEVVVLRRSRSSAASTTGVREIVGDRNHLSECRSELEALQPDVVLDVIPMTERQARGLVNEFHGKTGRVVALSSVDVYRNYEGLLGKPTADPDPVPLVEDSPLRGSRYPYKGQGLAVEHAEDYEKILVEETLRAHPDLPATILRLPAVYGPGDKQGRVHSYLAQMTPDNEKITLRDDQAKWRWSRGYVENVAAAIALTVTDDRSAGAVYNVGDDPVLTELRWAEMIAAASGWQGEVVAVTAVEEPEGLVPPPDWRYELWIDSTRIRKELGYSEPVPAAEAVERTVAWGETT
jgi:nucleoside-diphosphate-sugar epimerase